MSNGIKKLSQEEIKLVKGGSSKSSPYYEPWRTPGKVTDNPKKALVCAIGITQAIFKKDPSGFVNCI
ncbi:hypothetical protein [Companilactobacillus sp. HBUAS56257]|uniref:hypothetical protein n=1 Tax=Companilactobacillus sp. HBUAS56257 TaxID=3109360 RepID=UPI002FEFF29D